MVRTHTQRKTTTVALTYKIKELVEPVVNIVLIRMLNSKILAYSAIKIKANPTAPYSTLNPDTSSDSPSAKSKGVRLVSANEEIKNITTTGVKISIFLQKLFIAEILKMFIVPASLKKNNKIKANLTSYETVWAIPRRLPTSAYFLFEDHPLIITGNTFILIII